MPAFTPLLVRGLVVAALTYSGVRLVMLIALPNNLASLILGTAAGGAMAIIGALILDIASIRRSLVARVNIFNH